METENLGAGLDYQVDAHEIIWTSERTIREIMLANGPCEHDCANC